jgi:hypothetical protein
MHNADDAAAIDQVLATAPAEVDAWSVMPAEDGYPELVRIFRGWPRLGAWIYGADLGGWAPTELLIPVDVADPGYEPDGFLYIGDWSSPIEELYRQIPETVREAVRPLPDIFQWWTLLLLSAVPEALELVQSSPILAGLLAYRCKPDSELSPEDVRPLLGQPRRRLLRLLDLLPEKKWIIRALLRIHPLALLHPGPGAVMELMGSTDKRQVRLLQHLPDLDADVLRVLRDPTSLGMSTFSLLADPGNSIIWSSLSLDRLLADVAQAREEGRTSQKPARYRTRAELLAAFNSVRPIDLLSAFPGDFAVPSGGVSLGVDPVLYLRPVGSAADMLAHGRAEENCLPNEPSFFKSAHAGDGAMYVVRWAEEDGADAGEGREPVEQVATLWLRHCPPVGWEVNQLLAKNDQEVPDWVACRAEWWVDELNGDDGSFVVPAQVRVDGGWQLLLHFPDMDGPVKEPPGWL